MVLLDRWCPNHNILSHLCCLTHETVTLNVASLRVCRLKVFFCFCFCPMLCRYQIMRSCWDADPLNRPPFRKVVERIEQQLSDTTKHVGCLFMVVFTVHNLKFPLTVIILLCASYVVSSSTFHCTISV